MGMNNTRIIVEGCAPADVGWLNSGAEIVVKGDAGDTASHCAATGKIYVGGRTGTRSGALMKYDPKFPAPVFWVLKNTGSFSFEFMGGGIAVVCGHECDEFQSVLGDRACTGMVGGTIYVRGNISNVSDDVWIMDLDSKDLEFLKNGLSEFLSKIEKPELFYVLNDFSQWRKIVAKTYEERKSKDSRISLKEFRLEKWVKGGIFGDLIEDDYVAGILVPKYKTRLKIPKWNNHAYSAPCEFNCPIGIPTQKRFSLLRQNKVQEALELVLDYSPFPASVCGQVCPNLCVTDCSRIQIDEPLSVATLGICLQILKPKSQKLQKSKKLQLSVREFLVSLRLGS
jgi:hypothetical protein